MIIILLLLAPALCEWVEISQHHVRKPARTHTFKPIIKTEEHFEDTTRATLYPNQTLTEHPWSKGNVNKVPKLGNIHRVQLDNSPIKAPSLKVNPVRNSLNVGSIKHVNNNDNKESTDERESDLTKSNIHKISGSANTDRYKTTNRVRTSNIEKMRPATPDAMQETSNKDKETKVRLNNNKNRPTNQVTRVSFNKPFINPDTDDFNNHFEKAKIRLKNNVTLLPHISDLGLDKSTRKTLLPTEPETFNREKEINMKRNKLSQGKIPGKLDESLTSTQNVLTQRHKQTQLVKTDPPKIDNSGDRHSGIIKSKLPNHDFVTKLDKPTNEDMEATVTDSENENANTDSSSETDNLEKDNVKASTNNKANSIENLMTFMKVVADTIRKNTQRGVNSKTRYLTNLKNSILDNIAERIDATWPDDEPAKRSRKTRAAHASPRGHLEIPSSESALMTISFLTFAVFLIKLVLQVIQTYKSKAMMVSPAVVAVGRAAAKSISKP